MRPSHKVRPRLEGMESRALLSGAAAMASASAVHHTVHLHGTVGGGYAEHQGNPDFPKMYTLSGSGLLGQMSRTTLTGNLQAGGFTTHPGAHGTVLLADAHGTIKVNLAVSTGGGQAGGPSTPLNYTIVGGTGTYKGASGHGSAVLTLDRNAPPTTTNTGQGGFSQRGTFDLAFSG